jgi:hypothetical protein
LIFQTNHEDLDLQTLILLLLKVLV